MAKKKANKRVVSKKKVETPYFIGLNDPIEIRKNLLEPTREVIQFLQSYEQFKKIKEEKTQTILQLKEDFRLIKASINALRRQLPRGKIKLEKPSENIKEEVQKERKKPVKKTLTELDALDQELGNIEQTLGNL